MRVGCIGVVLVLLGFVAYGLYISWGFVAVFMFAALVAGIGTVIYFRLKNSQVGDETTEKNEEESVSIEVKQVGQTVLQDPDSLLAQFRQQHTTEDDNISPLANEEEAFQRAVEEVKKQLHAEDSDRMTWIRTFEQYTDRFVQRTQLKTNDPLMKRLNSLFILNGLLYIRVFVNLVEIAQKMDRLSESAVEKLDDSLARLSKQEYERLNRIIVLHYVDLFLADHAASIYFDDTFTKRSLTTAVMEGLSFGKQETLLLQAIQTDTQYIEVLLSQMQVDPDKQLIDLAKTAFENTQTRLIEKVTTAIQNQAR